MQYMLSVGTHYFCFKVLTSYIVRYSCVQKFHGVPYPDFGTYFFPKPTSDDTLNTVEHVNDAMRIKNSFPWVSS